EFAKANLSEDAQLSDSEQSFPHQDWKACTNFDLLKLALPAYLGGPYEEVNFTNAMLAMDGFGYGCRDNGLSLALNLTMWTVMTPILHFGTAEQHEKYLKPTADGHLMGCHALTEPDAGSDVMSMQMTAERVEGGYLLNGQKVLISMAPISDYALVFANARPEMGSWGITAFIIDKGTPGFTQSPKMDKMGVRSVPIGSLNCRDCFVPDSQRLGAEGGGFSIVNHSLEYDRCAILASSLGAMERQLEESVQFVKNRKQFGQPIGSFQSVSNRIVDMKMRLELARLLFNKTLWQKEQGQSITMLAAMLKLYLSEAYLESSIDALRNRGGSAYLQMHGLEREVRDAFGGVLYAGTSDIQRKIIAELMGL
ncbi:MAG: acyl-CoA dehydrogenase family protein, partial [Bacteroidota bacterium]